MAFSAQVSRFRVWGFGPSLWRSDLSGSSGAKALRLDGFKIQAVRAVHGGAWLSCALAVYGRS